MIKEQVKLLKYETILLDAVLIGIAFWISYCIRQGLVGYVANFTPLSVPNTYYWIMFAAIPLWLLALRHFGMYDYSHIRTLWYIIRQISKSCIVAFFMLVVLIYFLDRSNFSRALLVIFIAAVWALLIMGRGFILAFQRNDRKNKIIGFAARNILVVGTDKSARKFMRLIETHRNWGLNLVGYLNGFCKEDMTSEDVKLLGDVEEIEKVLEENVIDEVLFAVPPKLLPDVREAIEKCEEIGVNVHIAAQFFSDLASKTELNDFAGIPVLTLSRVPRHTVQLFVKRSVDIIVSLIAIFFSIPILVVSTVLIRLDSKGSVVFKQIRCGKNGRKFGVYKLRTMYIDAEKRLAEVAHLNLMSGPVFKAENDPRITKTGRIMRKLSVDELPQLWNVLKGDMSLVGPRPPLPKEVEKYERWQRRRLSMRPGITCLWQVGGRNDIDFEDWMRLDLKYIDSWSLWLDLKIILKTVPAVLFTKGAK
ncbi:MAG: sugar transferase [Planctomycetota bacterium]